MGVIPPLVFWPAAATLAALCALLVLWFSARTARRVTSEADDPARAVYRRQLADLDDLVERGLLPEGERAAAHAEAARRLLATPGAAAPERAGARLAPVAVAALAALAALGLYLWIGAPGQPDQPFRARLNQWRNAPVNTLRADQVAAVLREVARDKPNDARLLGLLGRVERAAGDPVAAAQDLERATRLEPANADLYAALGDALAAAAGNKPTPEAEAALGHALQLDPNNPAALYYLGGARAADGDRAGAAGLWRRLAAELPDQDARRRPLLAMADQVERGSAANAPASAQAPSAQAPSAQAPSTQAPSTQARAIAAAPAAEQAGFIRGMVASLQARLDAHPDDPAGWARLVRAYHVLGDGAAEGRALARARSLFKGRPDQLAPIEAAAK